MLPRTWNWRQRATMAAVLLYAVVFIAMLVMRPGGKQFYHGFNDVYQILPPLFAFFCCIACMRSLPSARPARKYGWALVGAASLSFAVGQATWTYYETIRGVEVPSPGWADIGYLGAYPFLVVGVLLMFGKMSTAARVRRLLDSAIASSSVAVLSWHFLVEELWSKSGVSLLAKLISMAYPLGDIAVLFGALALYGAAANDRPRKQALALLAAGMVLIAFFDTTYALYSLHNAYQTGSWFDWSLSFGYLLIGLGALSRRWWPGPASEESAGAEKQDSLRTRSVFVFAFPYVAAGAAFGTATVHEYVISQRISVSSFAIGSILISLVVVRQIFTFLENQHLTRELAVLNENLEHIVHHRTRQLTALYKLAKAVNNTLDARWVLAAGLDHTQEAMRADAIAISLCDDALDGDAASNLVRHHGFGDHAKLLEKLAEMPAPDQPQALSAGELGIAESDSGWVCLRAALKWPNRTLGSVAVLRWEAGYGDSDLEMLESIGLEVGTAYENARQYAAAVDAADRDSVTGLFNHRAVHQRLDNALARAEKRTVPVSIIMMDLDNFKLFNDTYGHPAGDCILKRVATILREECDKTDIVGRYGGDEFLAVLPDSEPERAFAVAERLSARMAAEGFRKDGDERTVPVALSFGIASFPRDSASRHELLTIADSNLYTAKDTGQRVMGTTQERRLYRQLRSESSFEVLDVMVTAVDNKDRYTRRHSDDVTKYALWIAEELGLSEETMRVIRLGGLLYDVGKIGVPDEVLRKPGRLTDEEYTLMKRHAEFGSYIVSAIPGMESIVPIVRSHHERWDGKGYPDGLAGEEAPLLGRLVAVADAVSAMTTTRPYRKAMDWEAALEEVRRNIGSQFDPTMAEAFLRVARGRELETPEADVPLLRAA